MQRKDLISDILSEKVGCNCKIKYVNSELS